jgi:hypothetical protein
MICEPELANSNVLPSAGARATCSVASTPPAPPRFSTTISVLSRICISSEISRASVSTGLPAANGTTTLMVSAAAVPASPSSSSATVAPKRPIMSVPDFSDAAQLWHLDSDRV